MTTIRMIHDTDLCLRMCIRTDELKRAKQSLVDRNLEREFEVPQRNDFRPDVCTSYKNNYVLT